MSTGLSLSDPHNGNVINYMRFARYQRDQRLRVVDACFKDLKNGRLMEDTTFTRDELDDILCTLKEDIRTEFESELLHTAHTNVVLLTQLFKQAEQWHLTLAVDISELENRELLQKIKLFEEEQFSAKKDDKSSRTVLEPVNEYGGSTLLRMEIDRLQKENSEIRRRLITVEESAIELSKIKTNLMIELEKIGGEKAVKKITGGDSKASLNLSQLEKELAQLKLDQRNGDTDSSQFRVDLEEDLIKTKKELLSIQAMLEMKEKELEKKVSETVPFKNLKTMLVKKNEQMKDLRQRLGKYEEL